MARITYRKTRKGETITMHADKGEDLRGVVEAMATPAKPVARLYATHVDMLYRVALAEHFTSPSTPANYDTNKVLADLLEGQYVARVEGVFRLTDAGREQLDRRLGGERREQLERVRARKAVRS